jgi:two-component system, sensor histidine kinase and response regulator
MAAEDGAMTPDLVLVGSYDVRVVALSIVIAVLASYVALDLGERVTAARGRARLLWLIGGATAMGIGIWSMHYTGMLAFHLPVPMRYYWPTALVSLLTAMFASVVGLFVASRRQMGWQRAIAGSLFMGGGIVGLHYIAMASMRLPAMVRYSPPLVLLSVLLAIVFSLLALWLTFLFRDGASGWGWRKAASALLMGGEVKVPSPLVGEGQDGGGGMLRDPWGNRPPLVSSPGGSGRGEGQTEPGIVLAVLDCHTLT